VLEMLSRVSTRALGRGVMLTLSAFTVHGLAGHSTGNPPSAQKRERPRTEGKFHRTRGPERVAGPVRSGLRAGRAPTTSPPFADGDRLKHALHRGRSGVLGSLRQS